MFLTYLPENIWKTLIIFYEYVLEFLYNLNCSLAFLFFLYIKLFLFNLHRKKYSKRNKANSGKQIYKYADRSKSNPKFHKKPSIVCYWYTRCNLLFSDFNVNPKSYSMSGLVCDQVGETYGSYHIQRRMGLLLMLLTVKHLYVSTT